MKLLLKQQKEIYRNYKESKNVKPKDYINAINQHLETVKSNIDLFPVELKKRKSCNCDSMKAVMFENIDGAFCPDCGFVYPF